MELKQFIQLALEEDVRDGDHSSLACIPADSMGKGKLLIKEDGVLAGVEIAKAVFAEVDSDIEVEVLIEDGADVKYGDIAFYVTGRDQSLLKAERLVLNLMQRMSGIATNVKKYSAAVAGTNTKVLDTRKTTPNLRYFEKLAVKIGGGHNHRFGLYDMIMLKDNHVDYAGGIENAILKTKNYLETNNLDLKVIIEVRNLDELQQVLDIGYVDRIMLDNFSPDLIREGLKMINGRFDTEASGGITLATIRSYAETGVDYISVGALTHSVDSLDMSLKAVK